MSATNRANKYAKLHKVAKKHYSVVKPPAGRSVLEHLLYGCCLQNSQYDQADEAMARIQRSYFDWNEVRVTTSAELADVMNCLNHPFKAATRLKKTLNSVFETHYAFDIDFLRKENLGKAIQKLDKGRGVTPFVLAYVAQNGLSGHQIGVDEALLEMMYIIGAIDEKEKAEGKVPGLERAIPKTKGVDFFSSVHQLAVALHASPFKPDLRKIVLTIAPDAKDRFAKRVSKKAPEKKPSKPEKAKPSAAKSGTAKTASKSSPAKPTAAKSGLAKKKPVAAKKKTAASKQTSTNKKKPVGRPKSAKVTKRTTAKSPTKSLKKKKPR